MRPHERLQAAYGRVTVRGGAARRGGGPPMGRGLDRAPQPVLALAARSGGMLPKLYRGMPWFVFL